MRRVAAALLILGLAVSAQAADVEFIRVWPQWRKATAFKRISEYFTGRENTGGQIIRRTHPNTRDGFYFVVRVKHPAVSLDGAKFVLQIITPLSPEPKQFTFSVDAPPGEQLFELGLTGDDWKGGRSMHPVAWKLGLLAENGRPLVSAQSFMWAKPE